ncbi:PAS modulated sigma54 specific transcriptional regulator, Fis family [Anaeromyxobacter sp. K]|uniref:sigma-54 interaction domain-containing protein n=1 Tax=Anaeromyxobacter sp. (strain K) TaxID=447217 RepID=UPI00017BE3D6|nr:sigma-54-dependent Fis family transcriptional regulator [Anaeromyxobacter sp. K]ACG74412.1 PAS modulated sigma54 specific transcriptional regulator, Fis family [Anaeromyxobacter sp. K]
MPPPSAAPLPFLGLGSEDALRAVADALPDGLFTTDAAGRITFWNRAAARITGWSSGDAVGRDCSLLAGDPVHGCACGAGPIRCGMAERERTSKTCSVRTRDDRLLVIVKSAVPLLAPDGTAVGALESFSPVDPVPGGRRQDACARPQASGLLGRGPAMEELRRMIALVARSDATVMLHGESGSGKERVAEAIHAGSARAAGPFVRVNCSALNENLLESELFGHVRGAFTGALRDRRGRFQDADGGTLLLDEIGDISPLVQVKLLRVIEQRQIERVGDSAPVPVDVRIVCATHRDLRALVDAGRFRADLYFRLAVFPLRVPPLREHVEDLPEIATAFLERHAPARGGRPRALSAAAIAALSACTWPGNVRELQNVLEFAALQAGDGDLGIEHLPAELRGACAPPARRPGAMPGPEEIRSALEACGGRRAEAARRLGISRGTLWKRMRALAPGSSDPG